MAESELQNVLLQTVGRSHPLLVHFLVALLVPATALASTHPEIRIPGLPLVDRTPVPEVVVKPETVAEVQPDSVQPEATKGDREIASERVNFLTKIKPTFEARSVSCQGPKKKKGQLRLETIAEAFPEDDKDWLAILPGEPAEILLVEMVKLSEDDDGVMPPRGELLSKEKNFAHRAMDRARRAMLQLTMRGQASR